MDDALRKKAVTLKGLWAELRNSGRGVRGTKIFRALLEGRDDRDGDLESRLEAKLLVILRRMKDVSFEVQYPVTAGGKNYRLDFCHVPSKLVIEGHSFTWHFGDKKHDEDSERHNALTLAGYRILYFTWDEVTFRPAEVEAQIRTALGPFLSQLCSA